MRTVVVSWFALAITLATLFVARTSWAAPSVTIVTPAPNDIVEDGISIQVTVTSVYLVTNVHAQAQSAGVDLTCVSTNCTGTLLISSLPTGPVTLVVTATDALNATGSSSVNVTRDHPPVLDVQTPDGSLALPTLRLKATCTDSDNYPCATVTALPYASVNGALLDQVISLAQFADQTINITFTATDTLGVSASKTISVLVSPTLACDEVARGTGGIVDVDATRILFKVSNLVIRSWDFTTDVYLSSGYATTGFLTQLGAIWTGGEYRNGTTVVNNATEIVATAKYAAWLDFPGTFGNQTASFRDIVAGTTTTIVANQTRATPTSIAANGDVILNRIYGSAPATTTVGRYRNGVLTDLTTPSSTGYQDGVTDGTFIAYIDKPLFQQRPAVWLDKSGGYESLDTKVNCPGLVKVTQPYVDYQVAFGWTVFERILPNCVRTLYTRDPNGVVGLVSPFPTDSTPAALAETGEVLFFNGGETYLGKAGTVPTKVANDTFGKFYRLNGKWYRALGQSLFKFPPTQNCQPSDAGVDGSIEAGTDASVEAGVDAGIEAGVDASVEAGDDGSVEGGSDASLDATVGPDAGESDGSIDAPPVLDDASEGGSPIDGGSADTMGGGGCSMSGGSGSPVVAGLLGALSLLLARRRRSDR